MNTQQLEIIQQLINEYNEKIKVNPTLYQHVTASGKQMIQIYLPEELAEYRNAAAGHGLGIRRIVGDADLAVKSIYASVENFVDFLESSECNLPGIQTTSKQKKRKAKAKQEIDLSQIPAKGNMYKFFSVEKVREFAKRLGGAVNFQLYLENKSIADVKKSIPV